MKENNSPEEKLLKLIKKQDFPAAPAAKINPGAQKNSAVTSLPKPSIRKLIYPFRMKYAADIYIKKIAVLFLALTGIYVLAAFLYPWLGPKKINLPDIPQANLNLGPNVEQIQAQTQPYEFYARALAQRKIFSNAAAVNAGAAAVATTDITKNLSLVGIISGDNPQAVIEDKKAQKTYYLNKGQYIGQIQIEDIQEGKIILNSDGQRYELYL